MTQRVLQSMDLHTKARNPNFEPQGLKASASSQKFEDLIMCNDRGAHKQNEGPIGKENAVKQEAKKIDDNTQDKSLTTGTKILEQSGDVVEQDNTLDDPVNELVLADDLETDRLQSILPLQTNLNLESEDLENVSGVVEIEPSLCISATTYSNEPVVQEGDETQEVMPTPITVHEPQKDGHKQQADHLEVISRIDSGALLKQELPKEILNDDVEEFTAQASTVSISLLPITHDAERNLTPSMPKHSIVSVNSSTEAAPASTVRVIDQPDSGNGELQSSDMTLQSPKITDHELLTTASEKAQTIEQKQPIALTSSVGLTNLPIAGGQKVPQVRGAAIAGVEDKDGGTMIDIQPHAQLVIDENQNNSQLNLLNYGDKHNINLINYNGLITSVQGDVLFISFDTQKDGDIPLRNEQIAISIGAAVSDGKQRVSLSLYPESLGSIDIEINFSKIGEVHSIKFLSEKEDTLKLLSADIKNLQNTLREVVNIDDAYLSFDLKHNNSQHHGDYKRFLSEVDEPKTQGADTLSALTDDASNHGASDRGNRLGYGLGVSIVV